MITLYEKAYSFTRPNDTTPYAAGDLVANSTTANQVVPLSWTFPSNAPALIPGIMIAFDKADLANAQFRLHLLHTIPTFTSAGDNSAVATVVATGHSYRIGCYEGLLTTVSADGASGLLVPVDGIILPVRKNPTAGVTTTLYGYLEARAAYTPKAQGVITSTLILEK